MYYHAMLLDLGCTIPGGVQKLCRYGTSGHGFAGMVVMG